jgi:hypothetical protein
VLKNQSRLFLNNEWPLLKTFFKQKLIVGYNATLYAKFNIAWEYIILFIPPLGIVPELP